MTTATAVPPREGLRPVDACAWNTGVHYLNIIVVPVTDSFRALWDEVATDCNATLVTCEPDAPFSAEGALILVAAGGRESEGLDVVSQLRSAGPPVYLVGANPSHRFAIETVRRGARDYFALPGDLDLFRRAITAVCEQATNALTQTRTRDRAAFSRILGESPQAKDALERAGRVAELDGVTLLIQGETGTGKELVARAVHDHSLRRDRPFVPVNCAAIPENLIESELFGHERGAFTDAHRDKKGLFEEAHTGTLFLDEVGHLPVALQAKILRALEERSIRRVGGAKLIPIDVRIISASHVQLDRAVREGQFREDLFYRLNVVNVTLPPLRERGRDVEILAEAFIHSVAERYALAVPGITSDFRTALHRHDWPGNVRELKHAIERAVLLSKPGTLDAAELGVSASRGAQTGGLAFPMTLRALSTEAAREAVRLSGGNKSAAARLLDISRTRLQRLLDGGDTL